MKILGIVGSPRKNGNTHVLVSRILDGARDRGAETETVLLGELSIGECDGCHACWKKDHICCKRDDMTALYPRIAESDVLVFGTPVYWYGPTALMKCFIDRFVYFNCPETHEKIAGKNAVVVIPFEEDDERAAELIVPFFEKSFDYLDVTLRDRVLVPGVTKRGEVQNLEPVMERCFNLGQNLAG